MTTIQPMLDRIEYWSAPWEHTSDDVGRRDSLARIHAEVKRLRAALAEASHVG